MPVSVVKVFVTYETTCFFFCVSVNKSARYTKTVFFKQFLRKKKTLFETCLLFFVETLGSLAHIRVFQRRKV